ncbi:hypothetical protein C8Q73DRAFT_699932 [Cubamyces lactineus]|nr:hypothetical protein C8Q73DRAFT_699932 [Cubamyces lactineus]
MKPCNDNQMPEDRQARRKNFCGAYHAAVSSLRNIVALRHVSREKLREAALDITIVAFGVRTGYLFDAFAIRDRRISLKDVFVEYLTALRAANQQFCDLVIVYEPHAEQLFVVNIHKLRNLVSANEHPRSATGADAQRRASVIYVLLDGSSAQATEAPLEVQSLIHKVASDFDNEGAPLAISLANVELAQDIGTMVAFAACILDFPVAYVPTSGGNTAYLAGVPLHVYQCVLVVDEDENASQSYGLPRRHTAIKFSCPQHVAQTNSGLLPETLVHNLKTRLEEQLQAAGFPGRVVVEHSTETLDRVAL